MMLQHPGPSLADISCSALVPCLSPPGSLTLDDFTNFSPVVKEELRLAIHSRRRSAALAAAEGSDGSCSSAGSERPSDQRGRPEGGARREVSSAEQERRRRRRERNKVAAAKCRNKKKEKTEGLQKESEKLESVNAELKAQIEELKQQKQQLVYMLNLHRPTCIVRAQQGRSPDGHQRALLTPDLATDLASELQELRELQESCFQLHSLAPNISTCSSTSTISSSSAGSPPPPLEGAFLSLHHVHCAGHL